MNLFTKVRVSLHLKAYSAWRWIWGRTDVDFRRLCVMASLHAVLAQCSYKETEQIKALNQSLHLVRDIDALKLPILFSKVVWTGVLPIEKIDASTDIYIERIARMTPCWLQYTDRQSFIAELKQLFVFCRNNQVTV